MIHEAVVSAVQVSLSASQGRMRRYLSARVRAGQRVRQDLGLAGAWQEPSGGGFDGPARYWLLARYAGVDSDQRL